MKGVDMALEMKCICPDADFSNMVSSEYPHFTLAEAAAVASGYSPCCTRWRTNNEFSNHYADPCEAMDLWEQQLRRAVAGGELKSVHNRLAPTERLIPREALESWMEEHKREEVFEEKKKKKEPLLAQRVKAIEEAITAQSFDPQAITLKQKAFLKRKITNKKNTDPKCTEDSFAKAWIEGGRAGKWAIKDKKKFLPR